MYRWELINNHYVVFINGKKYLVDTGSPISFWINPDCREPLIIDNVKYSLHSKPNSYDVLESERLIGTNIDGFIGLDMILKTSLTIYKNGRLEFGVVEEDGTRIGLNTNGFLSIKCNCGGVTGNYLIDTGAKFSYGTGGLFYGLTPFNQAEDYNPILKRLYSDIYHLNVNLGCKSVEIDTCYDVHVSSMLISMGVLLIGNITSLFNEVCVIDTKKGIMVIR